MGLHGDGVPIGGNMNEDSLDAFNVNLVSSKTHHALRVPFTCIQLRHLATDETFKAIVAVFCWSMRCLATGCHPVKRHDGTPFGPGDAQRQAAASPASSPGTSSSSSSSSLPSEAPEQKRARTGGPSSSRPAKGD